MNLNSGTPSQQLAELIQQTEQRLADLKALQGSFSNKSLAEELTAYAEKLEREQLAQGPRGKGGEPTE